ncbi:hypothetical protein MPNT_300003 [Candidatus Methylacidithermus pantelleriae]|uniref:Uncharacterized protein n=1 Tax=Candidatus Methylacidithermus pantelleriae TaxID=2744239 RepID=A0A8J2BQQ2_9BACT|nr:hypothetical protein MPNT_300003 [Candidatus Methylacidithermus pantelleriae]
MEKVICKLQQKSRYQTFCTRKKRPLAILWTTLDALLANQKSRLDASLFLSVRRACSRKQFVRRERRFRS